MSFVQEIRSKMAGVKNTQKITRAMEMVAASKMRKAQDRMLVSRPYASKIREVIARVASTQADYKHPYWEMRTQKRVAFIIVTSDRGLCGGLNTNLLKMALQRMKLLDEQNIATDLCLIGSKATGFFKRVGGQVLAQTRQLGETPQLSDIIGVVKVLLDNYKAAKLDSLFIAYNEFVNTMTQKPRIMPLVPIEPASEPLSTAQWDYLYEPAAKPLLELLATRYIESQVYQAIVENIACEQAARMVAMKGATENAAELITQLQLAYNKARQAAITKELAEIVAGAEAI